MCEYKIEDLICSITGDIYFDPVVASDGHTYEKQMLKKILVSEKKISPLTREVLKNTYTSNLKVKSMVTSFLEKYPQKKIDQYRNNHETVFDTVQEFLDYYDFNIKTNSEINLEKIIKLANDVTILENKQFIDYVLNAWSKKEINIYLKHARIIKHNDNLFNEILHINRKLGEEITYKLLEKLYEYNGLDEFNSYDEIDNPIVCYLFCIFNYSRTIFDFLVEKKVNFNAFNKTTHKTIFAKLLEGINYIKTSEARYVLDHFVYNKINLHKLSSKTLKCMSEMEINDYINNVIMKILNSINVNKHGIYNSKYIIKKTIEIIEKIKSNSDYKLQNHEKMFNLLVTKICLNVDIEEFKRLKSLINIVFGKHKYVYKISINASKDFIQDGVLQDFLEDENIKIKIIDDINANITYAHYLFACGDIRTIKLCIEKKIMNFNTPDKNNIHPQIILMNRCKNTENYYLNALLKKQNNTHHDSNNDGDNDNDNDDYTKEIVCCPETTIYDLFGENKMISENVSISGKDYKNTYLLIGEEKEHLKKIAEEVIYKDDLSITMHLLTYIFNGEPEKVLLL